LSQIIVFADNASPRLLKVPEYKSQIKYLYSNGEVKWLNVVMYFATFLSGKTNVVLIASDRSLTRQDVLDAEASLEV
jgi:hypothetical protein